MFQPDLNAPEPRDLRLADHAKVAATWVLVLVAIGTFIAAFAIVPDVFLVGFLGLLFGVFLYRGGLFFHRFLPLGYKSSLAFVVAVLLLAIAGALFLFGSTIANHIDEFTTQIQKSFQSLQNRVENSSQLGSVVEAMPFTDSIVNGDGNSTEAQTQSPSSQSSPTSAASASRSDDSSSTSDSEPASEQEPGAGALTWDKMNFSIANGILSTARRLTSTTLGVVINVLLIFFLGLFLASSPRSYRVAFVHLFPPRHRDRVNALFYALADTIGRWIAGRIYTMTITGVGIAISLWLVGMKAPWTLGLFAGLCTFIPNIGSAIAFFVAVLIALPQGMNMAIWVAAVFVGFQLLESYVITPMIQKHQVSAPPALLLFTQAVFGVLFGILGAMVAAPMLALAISLNKHLYQPYLHAEPSRRVGK